MNAEEALCKDVIDQTLALAVQADWDIVEKGWKAHVLGEAPHKFKDAKTAVTSLRVSYSSGKLRNFWSMLFPGRDSPVQLHGS